MENNKLGLTKIEDINFMEAIGIAESKAYMFKHCDELEIDMYTLKDLHKRAFGKLYDWAGKIRTTMTNIGIQPYMILGQLKQFLDNIKYRLELIDMEDEDDIISLLAEVHHRIVYIHPFVNGNGRIARLFTNLVSLKLMLPPFEIYVRDASEDRKQYIDAIKRADKGEFVPLKKLVKKALEYSIEQYEKMHND